MKRRALVYTLLASVPVACGGRSTPPAPTPPSTPSTPAATLYTVTGIVDSRTTGAPIEGARASVVDGPNAGLASNTDVSGRYTLSGLRFAGFSVSVTAAGYVGQSQGVALTAGVPTTTMNFSLTPENYSGSWRGSTSQGLPIGWSVSGPIVTGLTVDIRVTLAGSPPGSPQQPAASCLSTFVAPLPVAVIGNSFTAPVTSTSLTSPSGAFYSTTVRGSFASDSSASGSVASFAASRISCPGVLRIVDCSWPGATCSQGDKSWSATRQ